MKKVERVFLLANLLNKSGNWTSRNLAKRLECSERQIYRDLADLSRMGVPYYHDGKGYKLHSEAAIPPLFLSKEERMAIGLALSSVSVSRNPVLAKASQSASHKLQASAEDGRILSDIPVEEAQTFRKDLYLNPYHFQKIFQALEKKQILELQYHPLEDLKPLKVQVCSYALFYRRHHWYLAGWAEPFQDIRLFRVDRIRESKLLKARFKPDSQFDLQKYLENAWDMFPGQTVQTVTVKFSPSLARLVTETVRHPSQKIVEQSDGSVLWSVCVANLDEVRWWLMGLGSGVEVLEPFPLRKKILEEAEKMVCLYSKTDRNGQRAVI